ncbi:hypothetical protein [Variovorax boronicumulans]|uniref:hypothetical protein n=1 Tax=Variovorax boronicumulans TaxID=436515 RepID=UPI0012E52E68|nr:hypothetical protein [Variovorax boronicumulans]GER16710.1 hypothetical protein VCH24_17170 [Variovorax boronicumulans]
MFLIPRNWASFQHYKDRAPPWIKLHKGLLDDRIYQRLPLASKALAPMLWLLASESKDGSFDGTVAELAFRLRVSEPDITAGLQPLLDAGFFAPTQPASNAPSGRGQPAVPETETEGEAEKEGKGEEKPAAPAPSPALPRAPLAPAPAPAPAQGPKQKKPVKTPMPEGFALSERVKTWAQKGGYVRLDEHLEAFRRKVDANGYTYVDWDSAFMEAIREDWAKLRGRASNGAAPPAEAAASADPDSQSAVEAEGVRKGVGEWDQLSQWAVYKARVKSAPEPAVGAYA